MKIKNIVVFILIGFIAAACSKDPNDQLVLNLEGEFIISADQALTDNGPKFSYRISTLNEQDCKSSNILYTLIDQEGELNLILEEITQIEDCQTGKGNIIETIPLNIENETTAIAISLRNVVKNIGTIEMTESHYTLQLDVAKGILVNNKIVTRLPSQVVFGRIYNESEEAIDTELVNSLDDFHSGNLMNGYYTSNFSIVDGKAVFTEENNSTDYFQDVYFQIDDKVSFLSFLEDYKTNHPNYGFYMYDAANGDIIDL